MSNTLNKMLLPCSACKQLVALEDTRNIQNARCSTCGKQVVELNIDSNEQMLIDEFLVFEQIGSGGAAIVYLANQLTLDRLVALKVGRSTDPDKVRALLAEARVAAKMTHPNLVQTYKFGTWEGKWFIAQEYVEGQDLKNLIVSKGRLPWQQAVNITYQIAGGLAAAWDNLRVVHRDIKPENILVANNGTAKLTDLGLAISAEKTGVADQETVGTPHFMSPEQFRGKPLDVRSDIYSLGVTLYYALTGSFPFAHHDITELAKQHIFAPIPNVDVPGLPPQIQQILRRMLAKLQDDRYNERELLAVLELFRKEAIEVPVPETAASQRKGRSQKKQAEKKVQESQTATTNRKRVSLKPKALPPRDTQQVSRSALSASGSFSMTTPKPKKNVKLAASTSGSKNLRAVSLKKQKPQTKSMSAPKPSSTPSSSDDASVSEMTAQRMSSQAITTRIPVIEKPKAKTKPIAKTPSQQMKLDDEAEAPAKMSLESDSQTFQRFTPSAE